jgi:hypothetical protein
MKVAKSDVEKETLNIFLAAAKLATGTKRADADLPNWRRESRGNAPAGAARA